MITFVELGALGRLGNQLFQYAALKSVAERTGFEPKIPPPDTKIWQNQKCYLNKFSLKCEFLNSRDYEGIVHRFREPDPSRYYPQVFSIADNTDLYGFFQNYRYFSEIGQQIKEEFELDKDIVLRASSYIEKIRNEGDKDLPIVSVHMRRGDQSDGTNPAYLTYYGPHGTISHNSDFGRYFFKALEYFGKNVKYLVFSGGSRKGDNHNQSDIEWCKKNFNGDNVFYSEGNSDLVDFAIMSRCDHNLATHTTSFGWWAAFLNKNEDKIVVAPKSYTIPDDGRVQHGFYPPSWVLA